MYLRHSLIYLLAKIAPALSSFVLLAVYTRWMSAAEYGIYTTLLVVASSVSLFTFGWLQVSIMRFWESREITQTSLESIITLSIAVVATAVAMMALLFALVSGYWGMAVGFLLIFLSSAFYEAWQRINVITQQSQRYLGAEVLRTLITLLAGIILVGLGFGWVGAVGGVVMGVMLVLLGFGALWQHFRFSRQHFKPATLKALLRYGLPLSLSLVLLEVIHTADRLMIGHLLGFAAAGEYAVAYNLPLQVLMMLSGSLNLAAYPVIIRSLEHEGKAVAERKLQDYLLILLGISVPALLGLLAIAEDFIPLLVGEAFVASTLQLMPWLALALWANCLYLFYVSLAFQLTEHTQTAVKVVAWAAGLNVVLNRLLIPVWGLWGAVAASCVAYGICVVYGYRLGRRYFALTIPWFNTLKILLAALCMFIVLQLPVFNTSQALVTLVLKILTGMLLYGVLVWSFNVGQIRRYQLFSDLYTSLRNKVQSL